MGVVPGAAEGGGVEPLCEQLPDLSAGFGGGTPARQRRREVAGWAYGGEDGTERDMSDNGKEDEDGDVGGIPPLKSEKVTKVAEGDRSTSRNDGLTHGGAKPPEDKDRPER